ncbi:hypothetical protein [Halostagnicola sp. A-GB9-2]|uniref:hypothetical protein n=1 Tax=Halostagnicola sp. A-GB9-2 TaxID=3048066 RepID=UPI0024BF95BF|nr:hypothetical protein [Halostagnicola sp. A-GB9-2]MDJ1434798.1 hypothetical protein [Halostagnicola sp. A-GB9-2]
MSDDARTRGILTRTDREWLREQTDGTTSNRVAHGDLKRRREISERVANAFLDFELLFEELSPALWHAVFEAVDENTGSLSADLSYTVAVLYSLLNDPEYLAAGMLADTDTGASRLLTFRDTVQRGVARAKDSQFDGDGDSVRFETATQLYELPDEEHFDLSSEAAKQRWAGLSQSLTDPETGESYASQGGFEPKDVLPFVLTDTTRRLSTIREERRDGTYQRIERDLE